MSKRIEIEVAQDPRTGARPQTESEAFSISFLHEDPMLAMLTTSRLASLFIEENSKLREKQAVGTSEFLESQLKNTKAKLDVQEEKVNNYKMQYSGGLPQELATNLTNMSRLQQQEGMIAAEIRDLNNRKATLQAQLSMGERGSKAIFHDDGKVEVDTSEDSATVLARELNLIRGQLAELSAKYTDKYPEVLRLRGEVEELEKKLAEIPMSVRSSKGNEKNVSNSRTSMPLTGRGKKENGSGFIPGLGNAHEGRSISDTRSGKSTNKAFQTEPYEDIWSCIHHDHCSGVRRIDRTGENRSILARSNGLQIFLRHSHSCQYPDSGNTRCWPAAKIAKEGKIGRDHFVCICFICFSAFFHIEVKGILTS